MSPLHFKILDCSVDVNDFEEGAINIVRQVKPEWKEEHIKVKVLDGGFMNKIACCHLVSDTGRKDALVVRTYGDLAGDIIKRDTEIFSMQIFGEAGYCQPLVAIFNNGHVYGFAQGRTLEYMDFFNPDIFRKLTKVLARIHCLDIDNIELVDRKGAPAQFPQDEDIISQLSEEISLIPEQLDDPVQDKMFKENFKISDLRKEMDYVQKYAASLDLQKALIHGDFQPRNVIYNELTGELQFIDFELTRYSYRAMDLSRLFGIKAVFLKFGMASSRDPEMTEDIIKQWMKSYLEAWNHIQGRDDKPSHEQIECLYAEHKMMSIIGRFCFTVWILGQLKSPNLQLPDPLGLASGLLFQYKEEKSELDSLREIYLANKNI